MKSELNFQTRLCCFEVTGTLSQQAAWFRASASARSPDTLFQLSTCKKTQSARQFYNYACISCRHLTLRNTEVPGADPPHVRSCSQVHAQAPCLRRLLGTNTLANVMQLSKAKHLQPRRAALAHKQSRQAGAKNRKNSDAVAATIASWGGKGGLTGRC